MKHRVEPTFCYPHAASL